MIKTVFFAGALALLASFLLFPASLQADLTWHPDRGWQVPDEQLRGLTEAEAESALDLMNQAREHQEAGAYRRASRSYRQVYRHYPRSVLAPEAYFQSALIFTERRQWRRSFEAYQTITERYPDYPNFDLVIGNQYRIATALMEGARMRLFGVIPGFRSRERAVEFFEQVLANAPHSEYAPLSLMNIARLQRARRNREEAIDAYDRLINTYPESMLSSDAYLAMAQTHGELVAGAAYDQGATREAITYLEDFLILFPNDPGVEEAEENLHQMRTILAESKMLIGDFYNYRRSNYTAARVFYNEAITAYPDSPIADKARQKLDTLDQQLEDAG